MVASHNSLFCRIDQPRVLSDYLANISVACERRRFSGRRRFSPCTMYVRSGLTNIPLQNKVESMAGTAGKPDVCQEVN